MRDKRLACTLLLFTFAAALPAQLPAAEPQWSATWITHPTAPLREPIVLHFRRPLQLGTKPARYIVHVSADNRFLLYVNGHRVGDGPARGDLAHWRYETFDLAPFLTAGANLVAATVWNFGIYAPTAQITDRTAFLLQGDGALEADLSTPKGWMVAIEPGRIPIPRTPGGLNGYMANGPGEELNAAAYDWQWNTVHPPPLLVHYAKPHSSFLNETSAQIAIYPDRSKPKSLRTRNLTQHHLRVINCTEPMAIRRATSRRNTPRLKTNRSGVPITVYLDNSLNSRLNATSKERHVGKSSIIRLAVERLLTQLESGQLELPLGI